MPPGRVSTSYFFPDFNPSETRSSPERIVSRSKILVSVCDSELFELSVIFSSLDPQPIVNAVKISAVKVRRLKMVLNFLSNCLARWLVLRTVLMLVLRLRRRKA